MLEQTSERSALALVIKPTREHIEDFHETKIISIAVLGSGRLGRYELPMRDPQVSGVAFMGRTLAAIATKFSQ